MQHRKFSATRSRHKYKCSRSQLCIAKDGLLVLEDNLQSARDTRLRFVKQMTVSMGDTPHLQGCNSLLGEILLYQGCGREGMVGAELAQSYLTWLVHQAALRLVAA